MMPPKDVRSRRTAAMPPGRHSSFGTAGKFSAPPGSWIDPDSPHGYYVDLRSKATSAGHPPDWYARAPFIPHVVVIQWGLGCYEHYLAGGRDEWLAAATWVGDRLLEQQETTRPQVGGWVHDFRYRHTYRLDPPWLSGMAQGQGASLLVRLHRETGSERYAAGAIRALAPMGKDPNEGGVAARLGMGRLPEEYPTDPPSHVLNGAIFGVWGAYDVAVALGDAEAGILAREGIETLAASLARYDTGSWSRSDLFPHPTIHLASPNHHQLHINQLKAMSAIDSDPRFAATADRFERYARCSSVTPAPPLKSPGRTHTRSPSD